MHKVKNKDGQWLTSLEDIAKEEVASFQAPLNGDHCSSSDEILANIPSIITEDQNAMLTNFPTLEEVHNNVQDMNENNV